MMCHLWAVLGLLVLVCAVVHAAPPRPFALPLHVREDAGLARTNEPLASGIPLPLGAVMSPADLRVYGPTGKPVPCQGHQLGLCWPDGSLRWALVQFPASVGAGKDAVYTLKSEPGKPPVAPVERVTIRDAVGAASSRDRSRLEAAPTAGGDLVEVTTGPLRFAVSRTDFRLPNLLAVRTGKAAYSPVLDRASFTLRADREAMTPDEFKATGKQPKDLVTWGVADTGDTKWGKLQQGPEGKGIDFSAMLGGPVNITVEEPGPLRAVLRIERAAPKTEGEVGFVVRLYAYAGKPYVRVEYTLESYEQFLPVAVGDATAAICNSKHVREFALRLKPSAAVQQVSFGVRTDGGVQAPALQYGSRQAELGPDPKAGERAPGWMTATLGSHTLSLANKWFWEVAPRALSYDSAANELALELHPANAPGPGTPIPAGRVKTYEFLLGVDTPGEQLSALARHELRAYPDPDAVARSGATHRFVPLTDARFSKYADYVRKTCELAAKVRLYGDMDFGDQIGWNENTRWNGYHGVTHEWWTFFLASGDPALFRLAEQETWHSLDSDTQHWGYIPGCMEAEYARKHDHVCANPYQGGIKVWCMGQVDYYLLTGKRRVAESLARTANFLLNCGGVGQKSYTPERATSLPFLHLAYIYEAIGDEAALAQAFPKAMKPGAGRFRKDSIGPEACAPFLATLQDISRHFNEVYDQHKHTHSSFLASYPAEGFHRYYQLTRDPAGKDGVIKAAKYLYQDLAMPTGIIKYAGGPPWDVNSPWMPWWDGVDAPAALAYDLTQDKQVLDWGKAPVDWVLNYRGHAYSSGPWSFQGAMGFGGTLATYLWAMREAGMTQDDLTKQRTDLNLDEAVKTCQAKCNEVRERAMQNTGESGIFCRLVGEIGRVLIDQGKVDEAIAWLEPWKTAAYGVYVNMVLDRAKALQAGTTKP